MPLSEDDQVFIDEVRATFQAMLCAADSRIRRGTVLWEQFEVAAEGYEKGNTPERNLIEKVNELAVARELALDPTHGAPISYEPDLLPSGRKIDFVIERDTDNVYVEVKTVRPKPSDDEANWKAYAARRRFHPALADYIVGGEIGGTLYANSFSSRTKFLSYSLDFETRLTEAKLLTPGPGILVFCGTGFHWSVDELEDFADFYHDGHHRSDDPFSNMEAHHIRAERIALARNIDHFAFLKRPAHVANYAKMHFPERLSQWQRKVFARAKVGQFHLLQIHRFPQVPAF